MGDDAAVGEEVVGGLAEDPVGLGELGLHRGERLAVAVEVPPAGAVGDPVQGAGGRPPGLGDRLVRAAGDRAGLQDGAVPGHAGVVPRQPGQAAVRGEAGGGVEVVAGGDDRRLAVPQLDDVVDHLAVEVALADADQAVARGRRRRRSGRRSAIGAGIGRAGRGTGRRSWRSRRCRRRRRRRPAVLVHRGAGREGRGQDVDRLVAGLPADDHLATGLRRPALVPVQGAGVGAQVAEGHRPLHERRAVMGDGQEPYGRVSLRRRRAALAAWSRRRG